MHSAEPPVTDIETELRQAISEWDALGKLATDPREAGGLKLAKVVASLLANQAGFNKYGPRWLTDVVNPSLAGAVDAFGAAHPVIQRLISFRERAAFRFESIRQATSGCGECGSAVQADQECGTAVSGAGSRMADPPREAASKPPPALVFESVPPIDPRSSWEIKARLTVDSPPMPDVVMTIAQRLENLISSHFPDRKVDQHHGSPDKHYRKIHVFRPGCYQAVQIHRSDKEITIHVEGQLNVDLGGAVLGGLCLGVLSGLVLSVILIACWHFQIWDALHATLGGEHGWREYLWAGGLVVGMCVLLSTVLFGMIEAWEIRDSPKARETRVQLCQLIQQLDRMALSAGPGETPPSPPTALPRPVSSERLPSLTPAGGGGPAAVGHAMPSETHTGTRERKPIQESSATPAAGAASPSLQDMDRLTEEVGNRVAHGQRALGEEFQKLSYKLRRRPEANTTDAKRTAAAIAFLDAMLLPVAEGMAYDDLVKFVSEGARPMLQRLQSALSPDDFRLLEAQVQKLDDWARETCRLRDEIMMQAFSASFNILAGPPTPSRST